jgi:hypothetical protein
VCWTTPGIELIGAGSAMPSLTNTGSTSRPGQPGLRGHRRSAGVDAAAAAPAANPGSLRAAAGAALDLRRPLRAARRSAYSASASTSGADGGGLRLDVDPQAELLAVSAVCGPITATTVGRAACRRCRPGCARCDDEVKHTASKPPPLIASRTGAAAAPPGRCGRR